MKFAKLILLLLTLQLAGAQELLTLPGDSPLIDVRVQFEVGSIDDPEGKEGLTCLTALSLSEAGTEKKSYQDLLATFYPWAVSVDTTVGKEMVTFSATVHRDHLDEFKEVFTEMLTEPTFSQKDLDRLREKARNYLTQDLRVNNDEELGKETLYLQIYPRIHPYGHHNFGTVSGLEAVTTDDLRTHYRSYFRPERMTIGLAGGYPQEFPKELAAGLSVGLASAVELPSRPSISQPASPDGRRFTIVEKDTRSVAMSLGFPIEVNRSHPDWAALFLFRSFFGEHRSSTSHLYQRLREARGLNYGDYAYIEYFPNGMYLTQPEPNYPRSQQIFQIWIRPVQPETALFTLRATFFELEKVLREGLTEQQFEATRSYLKKNAPLLVASGSRELGYALDSKFYGSDPFVERLRNDLDKLTVDEVNRALRKHLQADNIEIVLVSKDATQLREELTAQRPSPMEYNSPKPQEILEEDNVIQSYPLKLGEIRIVPVNELFR
ncbi:MAG: pitrilysin family protein [Vulcanimicrobiota bacterium]